MSDGAATPSRFDGMAAFAGPEDSTILIRNHENKRRFNNAGTSVISPANEIDVQVPANLRYDPAFWNGGVTKLVVVDRVVMESYAVLGGTSHNCAGGPTPWGSWITCEEIAQPPPGSGTLRHGYLFEVDSNATGPIPASPITAAGRFEHEAVAWHDGVLYETEDRPDASFYRYTPLMSPTQAGQLATGGLLEALVVDGSPPPLDTRSSTSWPGGIGASHSVSWIPVPNPDPADDRPVAMQGVRFQAQGLGAAIFARTEGCWSADDGKVYFDCTTGGGTSPEAEGNGQVFALDPAESTLTLVYQSPLAEPPLIRPDNMVMAATGDLFLCEDHPTGPVANHIRGLTPEGGIFNFAKAETNPTEFCGACFDKKGLTMYVNQQGDAAGGAQGVTYAIWGPWKRGT